MASIQIYSQAEVYINGSKLAEEASVTVTRNTSAQKQYTLARGFAGMVAGPSDIEIKVTNAVPSAKFEINPGSFMGMGPNTDTNRGGSSVGGLLQLEVTIYAASSALHTRGFLVSDNFSHAVNAASSLEFSLVCDPADWVYIDAPRVVDPNFQRS